jgi:hypothetical protein
MGLYNVAVLLNSLGVFIQFFCPSAMTRKLETIASPSSETLFHSDQQCSSAGEGMAEHVEDETINKNENEKKNKNENEDENAENENERKPSDKQANIPLLSTLYASAQVTTLNDTIFVALHSFMLECGFRCVTSSPRSVMPDGWKQHHVYKVAYQHPVALSQSCSLVCVSLGPSLVVVHGSVDSTDQHRSKMQIKPSDFIRGDVPLTSGASDVYHNFSVLSERFKLGIAYQLIDGIKKKLGLTEQMSLLTLAPETKLHILGYLDVKSLLCCSRVCQELRMLAEDKKLWRGLFKATFAASEYSKNTDWKAEFKEAYVKRKQAKKASKGQTQWYWKVDFPPPAVHPQPCNPFPPGIVGGEHDRRLFPQFPIQPSPFFIPSPGYCIPFPQPVISPRPRFDPYGPLPEHRYDIRNQGPLPEHRYDVRSQRWNRRGPGRGGSSGNALF